MVVVVGGIVVATVGTASSIGRMEQLLMVKVKSSMEMSPYIKERDVSKKVKRRRCDPHQVVFASNALDVDLVQTRGDVRNLSFVPVVSALAGE